MFDDEIKSPMKTIKAWMIADKLPMTVIVRDESNFMDKKLVTFYRQAFIHGEWTLLGCSQCGSKKFAITDRDERFEVIN